MNQQLLSFTGLRRDALSGAYHPGNGYRAYYPPLMRFSCPDSISPFGAGGINGYSYCIGDPINRVDPSGHFSWQVGLGIGLSLLGMLAAIWTGGASLVAAGSLSSALESVAVMPLLTGAANALADISGLGSALTQIPHPQLSTALGWLAFAAGVLAIGAGLSVAGYRKLSAVTDGLRRRLGALRHIGLSGGAEAAGREMASAGQELTGEQRMALIGDPTKMTHDIHQLNSNQIISINNQRGFNSRLNAEYHPDQWIIWSMERDPDERFFMSDLVKYQYHRIARQQGFYGIMPDRIEQRLVINPQTRILADNAEGEELKAIFLTQTPNGKLIQRLAESFGFSVTHIEKRGNAVDYIAHIDNGL